MKVVEDLMWRQFIFKNKQFVTWPTLPPFPLPQIPAKDAKSGCFESLILQVQVLRQLVDMNLQQ